MIEPEGAEQRVPTSGLGVPSGIQMKPTASEFVPADPSSHVEEKGSAEHIRGGVEIGRRRYPPVGHGRESLVGGHFLRVHGS